MNVLLDQEQRSYGVGDYIGEQRKKTRTANLSNASEMVTEVWRDKMCNWFYEVTTHFEYHADVAAMAVSHFDRYLSKKLPSMNGIMAKKHFHLAAMTCLYLAIKVSDRKTCLSMAAMVKVDQQNYEEKDMVDMEMDVLSTLGWRVNGPTPYSFCIHFSSLISSTILPRLDRKVLLKNCLSLTEDAVCTYNVGTKHPSSVGLACLLLALENEALPCGSKTRDELMSRIKDLSLHDAEVGECYRQLEEVYREKTTPSPVTFSPPISPTSAVTTAKPIVSLLASQIKSVIDCEFLMVSSPTGATDQSLLLCGQSQQFL